MTKLFHQLLTRNIPLLDVRAEIEYAKGAFPHATNIPILNNQERREIGLCYKHRGPQAAETLGNELVSGTVREERLAQWITFVKQYPEAYLYCFRGGKRSQIACDWLSAAGVPVPRIPGGYKAMRSYLVDSFADTPHMVVVSGHTGVGKTDLLQHISSSIDLEGLANHRGSAFGKRLEPQPTQIDFENRLAVAVLKNQDSPPIVLEDEGRLIGRIQIPAVFKDAMNTAPVVVLKEPIEQRIDRILHDYIVAQFNELQTAHGAQAHQILSEQLLTATDAIRKRLGGMVHQQVRLLVSNALQQHASGNIEGHRSWIGMLLQQYYDPMYSYQLAQKQDRVVFSGSSEEIRDWFAFLPTEVSGRG